MDGTVAEMASSHREDRCREAGSGVRRALASAGRRRALALSLPVVAVTVLVFLLLAGAVRAAEGAPPAAAPFHTFLPTAGIRAYQLLISPARTTSCPMEPHCSAYGLLAFRTRNPLAALALTSDRLLRCGHDPSWYEPCLVNGTARLADPLGDRAVSSVGPAAPAVEAGGGASSVAAGTPEAMLYRFARELAREGDDERAITEYRRFLSYYPRAALRDSVVFALLDCYRDTKRYSETVQLVQVELPGSRDESRREFLHLRAGAAYLRLAERENADIHLDLAAQSADREVRARAAMLGGMECALFHEWEQAAKRFETVPGDSPLRIRAEACAALCRAGADLPLKSPRCAGILAVVPGLGYWYAGYPHTAASAFIVNGLFFWGTCRAFDRGEPGLGTLLAVASFGWYAGNIHGSVRSATRRNAWRQDELTVRLDLGVAF